ncbi:MAG TPA: rRNA maturation RNase YbeY [bacterium]|nr:rRNA maturation RNase YbeY [bacterium]
MERKKWVDIKNKILGKEYDLSIVSAKDDLMKKLNSVYRNKYKTTNTLSFSLSKEMGEIFINITLAKKEAAKAKIPSEQYIDYLFTHSILHLKGYAHGKRMREEENKIMKNLWGKTL